MHKMTPFVSKYLSGFKPTYTRRYEMDGETIFDAQAKEVTYAQDYRGKDLNYPPVTTTKAEVEEAIGHPIPEDVWNLKPWGHRVIVRRDDALAKYGAIYIPEDAKMAPASGFVISIGPDVGTPLGNFNGECPLLNTRDLIGCSVTFGRWAGSTLVDKLDTRGSDYESDFLLMTEDDIWGINENPPIGPPKAEAEEDSLQGELPLVDKP